MDVLALIASGIAIGFSVFAFFRQDSLQRRVAEIEEARRHDEVTSQLQADVTASFEKSVNSRGAQVYQFVLLNRGAARADNVTFEIPKPPTGEAPGIHMQGHSFPISLDPEQAYVLLAIVVMGTAPAVPVNLRWEDQTGPREKSLTLTVF